MVDPFTVSHMGQLGFFPLSSYSRPEGLFQVYKKCFFLYICSELICWFPRSDRRPLCSQSTNNNPGIKNLKIFGILLQWLPSSTLASGIISEDTSAGLYADLPNESNLGKAKYMHWRKHKRHTVSSPSREWILRRCSAKQVIK